MEGRFTIGVDIDVRTVDGRVKASELNVGDNIKVKGKTFQVKRLRVYPYRSQVIYLKFEDGSYYAGIRNDLILSDTKWKQLNMIKVGEHLFNDLVVKKVYGLFLEHYVVDVISNAMFGEIELANGLIVADSRLV